MDGGMEGQKKKKEMAETETQTDEERVFLPDRMRACLERRGGGSLCEGVFHVRKGELRGIFTAGFARFSLHLWLRRAHEKTLCVCVFAMKRNSRMHAPPHACPCARICV